MITSEMCAKKPIDPEGVKMNTLTKLRSMDFSHTEQRIADFIIRHADSLSQYTISSIAEACGTSKSMVVQLCKVAGFKGYKELCSQLLVEQALAIRQEQPEETFDDIHPGFTPAQIAQVIIHQEILCLQDTMDLIDPDALSQAVALIKNADRILLCGVGESGLAAQDMDNKLGRIGLYSRFVQDVHCQLLETTSLTENSVCIVFSFSGRTADMVEVCELAHEAGAKVISITRLGQNPVSELADVQLFVASSESTQRVTAMSSRMSTMSLVDVLFACLISDPDPRMTHQVCRNTKIANRRRK